MEATFAKAATIMTADEVIENKTLCKVWSAGKHTVGEVYTTADGQPWICYQEYDNAIYPDIAPGTSAWPTFNKPYHGTTPDTALPFIEPTHSQDIYKAGEYMIWTDGTLKKCVRDTAFSPNDDPNAWEDGE
jgi:hypothetical protein